MSGARVGCAASSRQTPRATERNAIQARPASCNRCASYGIVTIWEDLGGHPDRRRRRRQRSVVDTDEVRYPVVHVQGGSAIRRPLIILAVCAVGVSGYLARDFLIPTAAAIVLALMLTPVANERDKPTCVEPAAQPSTSLLAASSGLRRCSFPSGAVAGPAGALPDLHARPQSGGFARPGRRQAPSRQVAVAVPVPPPASPASLTEWSGAPNSHARLTRHHDARRDPPDGYACVLSFMLLAHRNDHRRQMLRIPLSWGTRVRLARMMRDINDRVGHYLFALAVIYACVAVVAALALALLGFPNAIMWGIVMGLASFVPFVGAPLTIVLVAVVALISFDDWPRIVGAHSYCW